MQRKAGRGALAAGVLFASLLAGCGGGSDSSSGGIVSSAPRQNGSLVYRLSVPKAAYGRGEAVPLSFAVTNVGTKAVHGVLGACDFFDTTAQANGQVVWQRSLTIGCTTFVPAFDLAPGETKTYQYTWNQTNTQGQAVAAGLYTLQSWFAAYNTGDPTMLPGQQQTRQYANPIQITIQ